MTSCEIDLRVGGVWRYVMVANGGFEVAFHGECCEIVPNERIASNEVYERMPEAGATNTLTFTELDGRTTVTLLGEHTSCERRDAHINSGMEDRLQDALDLLEQNRDLCFERAKDELVVAAVRDAGLTQVRPGTETVLATQPGAC